MKKIFKAWLDNRSIKREAWLYACIESRAIYNRSWNKADTANGEMGLAECSIKQARNRLYYDKMRELGGRF